MSGFDRRLSRAKLKKEYKKLTKGIPRNQRVRFDVIYKQARKTGSQIAPTNGAENLAQDFDMDVLDGILVEEEESNEVTDSQ